MFPMCSSDEAAPDGATLPALRRRPLAQSGQGDADVRSGRRERIPAPALAADRWKAGVSALRLRPLLRLSALGYSAALALQGLPRRFFGDIRHFVRLA